MKNIKSFDKINEELTSLERYPEFKDVTEMIAAKAQQFIDREIKKVSPTIDSKMPYKNMFIYEEIVKKLEEYI